MAQVPLRNQGVGVTPPDDDDEIPLFDGGGDRQQQLPNPSVFPLVPAARQPPLAALQEPLPPEEQQKEEGEEEEEDVIPSVSQQQPARQPKLVSDPNFGLFLLGIAHSSISSFEAKDNDKEKTRAYDTLNPLSMLHGQDGLVKTIHDFAAKLPLHELFADQLKGRYHCSNCRVLNPNHSRVCVSCEHNQDQELPLPMPFTPVFRFGPP